MDDIVFTTTAKNWREIRLTKTQWKHITTRHPEMASMQKEIKLAIENPSTIKAFSDDVEKFYLYLKAENKYIMVAVKTLNGEGFIITAYKTKKV